jgi:hypothetical protein
VFFRGQRDAPRPGQPRCQHRSDGVRP